MCRDCNESSLTQPLIWWNYNCHRFPKLAAVAKKVLSIPATSVASERQFSSARLVMPWNRTRLSGKTLQSLMCLKSWLKFKDCDDFSDDSEDERFDIEDQ